MRNPVVTAVTAASFVTGQLAVPAFAQTTLPYPPQPGYPGYDQGYAGTIRCESRSNRQQRCKVRTDNRVELVRVIGGRCSRGRDWGYDADSIWVSGGCRAEFRYGYAGGTYPAGGNFAGTIRCESRNNRYEQCNVATNDRVELTRRIGGRCNAGRQWGYTANYVWVNEGCRAEFGYGYDNWNNRPEPKPDKDRGPSTGLIIGGIVVAGGLLALLASKNKKKKEEAPAGTTPRAEDTAAPSYPAGPPATLSADLSALPSASRPSVQSCLNDAARQIGVTGGTRLSYDRLVNLEQGNGGWRIRAAMTATYPDSSHAVEMYCRATPTQIIQLDLN
jgi:hypothetical protein